MLVIVMLLDVTSPALLFTLALTVQFSSIVISLCSPVYSIHSPSPICISFVPCSLPAGHATVTVTFSFVASSVLTLIPIVPSSIFPIIISLLSIFPLLFSTINVYVPFDVTSYVSLISFSPLRYVLLVSSGDV